VLILVEEMAHMLSVCAFAIMLAMFYQTSITCMILFLSFPFLVLTILSFGHLSFFCEMACVPFSSLHVDVLVCKV
jgi:hypothetical protein